MPTSQGRVGIHFLCSNTAVPSLCIDFFCVQEAHENSQHTHTHVNILHTQCSLCTAELRHSIECMSIYASVQGVAVWEGTGGGQLLCTTHIAVYPSSAGTACPRWGSVSADKYLKWHLASQCALVCNLQWPTVPGMHWMGRGRWMSWVWCMLAFFAHAGAGGGRGWAP